MNAAQLTLDNIEKYGEYTSTWFEDKQYTNIECYDRACRFAEVLRAHGIQAGDHVVVMMLNSPDVTAAFTALWKLGAVMIPITPMWNAREARYVLEDSRAKAAITSPELAARLMEASADLPEFREVLVMGATNVDGAINIEPEVEAAAPYLPLVDCQPDDLAMLLYTSGTTGNPKGVMLSHENLIFVADACYQNSLSLEGVRGMQVLPLSHVYGVLMMNLGARLGSRSRILKHFDAGKVLATIEELRVQRLSLVPTMLTLLINHPDREKYDVSSLEGVGSGGAPLSEATRLEFERLFNCSVKQGYGLSETAGALTGYQPEEPYRVGSVGPALPGVEICIMDMENNILPAGATGEICSRGKHIMQGYLNKPEATRDTIIDGWLHTGDIGYMDADGYVFITDRKKDLVIKGGENISPREIEEGIYSHPAVAEAAVFGVPDIVYGENLVAAVVLRAEQSITAEDLTSHLSQYVTKFKLPAQIVFRETFPKGPSGKILKRVLRDEFLAEKAK
ncbi:MAG TPA: AMP-binding protein [Blastocatellia bacterium]|nr:AMP-binding protein [Blastocatellia bacterium]